MAERRMFAKTIIDSDAFLDMPLSTQALYFHLSMRADDDGFINNPKKLCRMIGSSDDEMKVLIAKKFLLGFESGVIVVKHWKIHNYIQKDRYKETAYLDEKSQLSESKNKGYSLDTQCIQDVDTGKDRLELGKSKVSKEIKTSFDLPLGVDKDLFDDFLAMRKKLKAPNTDRAINSLIKTLQELMAKGYHPNEIVQNSYDNGWKGLFEPKQKRTQTDNNVNVAMDWLNENDTTDAEVIGS